MCLEFNENNLHIHNPKPASACIYEGRKHNTKIKRMNNYSKPLHQSIQCFIHLIIKQQFIQFPLHRMSSHLIPLHQPLHRPHHPTSQPLQRAIIRFPMTLQQQRPQIRQSLLDFQCFRQRAHSKTLFRLGSRVVWRREICEQSGVEVGWVGEGGAGVVPGWERGGGGGRRGWFLIVVVAVVLVGVWSEWSWVSVAMICGWRAWRGLGRVGLRCREGLGRGCLRGCRSLPVWWMLLDLDWSDVE
jgi:hypothetical protein